MQSHGKLCYANKGKNQPDQDVKWYTSKSDAAIKAAQLGFTNATGATIEYAGSKVSTLPGIMRLEYAPTIGEIFVNASDPNWVMNPFNQAMKRIYTQMRRKNTASPVYNSPDLGVYLMCVDSLYNYYSYFARAFKVVNYYRNKNKYTAKYILQVMGIDPNDFISNLADFRIYLNSFAVRVNSSLSVPKLPMFERHTWINSHIWKDGNTDKSQLYIPRIITCHKYNFAKSEAGGGTDIVDLGEYATSEYLSISDIKDMGEDLIKVLLGDDDILLIAADIDKWYGGNQFILPELGENDKLEPEYSMEVLTQIQNIDIFPVNNGELVQDADRNTVAQRFSMPSTTAAPNGVLLALANKQFITMPFDDPKPEDIVVATRNTISLKLTGTSITSICVGSEIVTAARIYNLNGDTLSVKQVEPIHFNATGNDATTIMNALQPLIFKSYFDMSPKVYILPTTAENIAYTVTEFENSTPVTYDRLNQIHTQALYNEFGFYDTDHSNSTF